MNLKTIVTISIITIVLATSTPFPSVSAATTTPTKQLLTPVAHDMTINVVLIGFTPQYINTSYLDWNLEHKVAPIMQVNERTYGSEFNISYKIMMASSKFEGDLRTYLKSITSIEKHPTQNRTLGAAGYALIDASSTENWLNAHSEGFGGIPANGYTLLIANLSTISSYYHYYNMSYRDSDACSLRAKYYSDWFPFTCWALSFGGRYRFYYIDLSAGDPKNFYSGIEHTPIQDLFPKDRLLTTSSVTAYVSDYVYEAVRNLFTPSYCYSPTYSKSYRIEVLLFDNTTRITQANYTRVISSSLINSTFSEVIPYASWNVKISHHTLQSDLALYSVIKQSLVYDLWQNYKSGKLHYMYFDYRPIHAYLQTHLSAYINTSGNVTVLPIFCFIFSSGGNLANTRGEVMGLRSRTDPNGLWGMSMPDMILVSHSESDIFDRGFGLSRSIIHEVGHAIGLMHPHSYGDLEDYVSSPMSYRTYDYKFSQFDKDAVQRAHADYFISSVKEKLSEAQQISYESPNATAYRNQAQAEYSSGLKAYSNQNYREAIDRLNAISALIDKAFTAETAFIKQKISELGSLESPQAQTLIQKATDELAAATTSYQNGSYRSAYQRKAAGSTYVEQAKAAEQVYQQAKTQAKTAINEAQQKIDAVGKLESPSATSLIRRALDELAVARMHYQNGDYKAAYQSALTAALYVEPVKNAEQAYITINDAQQIINAVGKLESPQAQTLVQKATDILLVAKKSYQSQDYGLAYQYTIIIPIYIEQARIAEQVYQQAKTQAKTAINEAQQRISAVGRVESTEAEAMLNKAKEELASAESSFEKGNHDFAYQHAQASSIYADNARITEKGYQQQKLISASGYQQQELSYQQQKLIYEQQKLIYASVGLATGALLASVIWLWNSKRKKILAVPPSAPPPNSAADKRLSHIPKSKKGKKLNT